MLPDMYTFSMSITQFAIASPTSFYFAISLQCCISGAALILSRIFASVIPLYSLSPKYLVTNRCSTSSSLHVGWEKAGDDARSATTADANMVRTVYLPFARCFFFLKVQQLFCALHEVDQAFNRGHVATRKSLRTDPGSLPPAGLAKQKPQPALALLAGAKVMCMRDSTRWVL
jgi:hypothetical protein